MTALERAVDAVMSVERSYGDAFDVAEEGATNIVRAVLNSLRDSEYPGLLSLGMNELVDAILNETPE